MRLEHVAMKGARDGRAPVAFAHGPACGGQGGVRQGPRRGLSRQRRCRASSSGPRGTPRRGPTTPPTCGKRSASSTPSTRHFLIWREPNDDSTKPQPSSWSPLSSTPSTRPPSPPQSPRRGAPCRPGPRPSRSSHPPEPPESRSRSPAPPAGRSPWPRAQRPSRDPSATCRRGSPWG